MEIEMEAAKQPRLTIGKFCLAPVALRAPNDPLGLGEEDLTPSPLPTLTQQSQQAPLLQWQANRDQPTVPARIPSLLPRLCELSVDKVLVLSAVLDLLFNPSLWNARRGFPCHKNEPFLLFFLVSLKINKRASTPKPQTKYHVSSTTLESLPWIKRDSKTPILTA